MRWKLMAAGAVLVTAAGCGSLAGLLDPIDPASAPPGTPATVTDAAVTHDIGSGTTVTVSPPSGPRPTTSADVLVDGVAGVGGMLTGNPMLWGLFGQLGHMVVGALSRKRTA